MDEGSSADLIDYAVHALEMTAQALGDAARKYEECDWRTRAVIRELKSGLET